MPGAAETADNFGQAVATGDLDGDGYDDAVVGIPGEDIGAVSNAGGVVVLWGAPKGLTGVGEQLAAGRQTSERAARFGAALAAARFSDTTSR